MCKNIMSTLFSWGQSNNKHTFTSIYSENERTISFSIKYFSCKFFLHFTVHVLRNKGYNQFKYNINL